MKLEQDKAGEVRKGEEIDLQKLNNFLSSNGGLVPEIVSISQFKGGYSNLTFEIITEKESYVLRKAPAGAKEIKGGHDMAREFNILQKLANADFEKVPKAIICCEDPAVLGETFYIMEKTEGVILRAKDAHSLANQNDKQNINDLSKEVCLQQAKLHQIDIYATGLDSIGKPEGYVNRQVTGWTKRYLASQTEEIQQMNYVFEWLAENMPESRQVGLIHNDYKYDNMVLNPENLSEIKAILDWEMTTVGDPLMDLGSTLAYWCEAGDEDFTKQFNISWVPGNLSRKEYAALYAATTGFDIKNLLFYYVFGLFKNAVIIQQIYSRYHKGFTNDPRFKDLIVGVKVLAKKAMNSIEQQEMM